MILRKYLILFLKNICYFDKQIVTEANRYIAYIPMIIKHNVEGGKSFARREGLTPENSITYFTNLIVSKTYTYC